MKSTHPANDQSNLLVLVDVAQIFRDENGRLFIASSKVSDRVYDKKNFTGQG